MRPDERRRLPESNEPPRVIAEIGANHDGDMARAHRMIDAVAETGAEWVKFQFYKVEELVADPSLPVTWGPSGRQRTETLRDMFGRIALSREQLGELFEHARERGLVPFASPFSEEGVDALVELGAPMLKIAASDVNHLPLLRHAASTGVPVILSLGKCTLAEADDAVRTLEEAGCSELALLHCVASYPSPMEEMNLRVIPMLQKAYPEHVIGFSDHSLGISAPLAAVALGARIIEKHVTLSRNDEGPDHWFSLDMQDLAALVQGVRDVNVALGSSRKRVVDAESGGRARATRSLVAARDLPAGTILQREDVRMVRPGGGIPPALLDRFLRLEIRSPVAAGEQLQNLHFQPPNPAQTSV